MIAARSGHGTAVSFTNGSASAIACAYEPLSTVAGVASSPTRPLRVAATACTAPGWTTPRTSTPSVVCMRRWRSAGSAAAVALLQATTSSFTRRAISSSAISSANASSSRRARSPYGKRALSARYTKSSCGSWTSSSCSTVSPPTPESNTPTGRRRTSSGAGCGAWSSPFTGGSLACVRERQLRLGRERLRRHGFRRDRGWLRRWCDETVLWRGLALDRRSGRATKPTRQGRSSHDRAAAIRATFIPYSERFVAPIEPVVVRAT